MFRKSVRDGKLAAGFPDWLLKPPSNLVSGDRASIMETLFKKVFSKNAIKGIEVGVWRAAGSTQIWLNNCAPKSEFFLVDRWDPDASEFLRKNMEFSEVIIYMSHNAIATDNYLAALLAIKEIEKTRIRDLLDIHLIRGQSNHFLGSLDRDSFDFIYLDGDHRYENIKSDIRHSKRLIRKDFGIICGDDLEKAPTLELYNESISFKEEDFLRTPEKNYHPGVVAAIWEEFNGQVDIKNGFWWICCVNGAFKKGYINI